MVQPVSFHVKVKREKTSIFVECQVNDTVLQLKQKVAGMLGKSAKDLRLLWKEQPLDDNASLVGAGIGLDSILTLVYWIPNEEGKLFCCGNNV